MDRAEVKRTWQYRIVGVALALCPMLIASGCVTTSDLEADESTSSASTAAPTEPSQERASTAGESSAAADARAQAGRVIEEELRPEIQRWNRLTGPVVADLYDDTVSAEKWGADTRQVLPDLGEIVAGLNASVATIQHAETREALRKIARNYRAKWVALDDLVGAMSIGDVDGQRRALQDLQRLGTEALDLVHEFSDFAHDLGMR